MPNRGRVISAMFLVGGTCIGGGMLSIPIATGFSGFFPSLFLMAITCSAMALTGLLLSEATLWMKEDAHVISISETILGRWGKIVCWILYLFISYASIVAYTAGGGVQITETLNRLFNLTLTRDLGALIFILSFGSILYFGGIIIGRINSLLFGAMVLAYFFLLGAGVDEVNPSMLLFQKWRHAYSSLPIILTMFSFQTMVPSLVPYLDRDPKAIRRAILGGALIAFLIYCLWQLLILGIVPVEGPGGLLHALIQGNMPATTFLAIHVTGTWIIYIAEFFAFFAIITSFLGMGFGLFDFLSDGLKIPKSVGGKIVISALIIIPTYFCATKLERVFLLAMDASGGIGDTLLNGIIVILIVWIGRYHLGYQNSLRVRGGKPLLVLLGVFFGSVLILDIIEIIGWVPSIYHVNDLIELHNVQELINS